MTPKDLQGIRQRFERATQGPWVGDRYDHTIKYKMTQKGCECGSLTEECPHLVLQVQHKSGEYGFVGQRGEEDAEFVMHSRTDIPLLVEALEKTYGVLARTLEMTEPTCSLEELVDAVAACIERLSGENRYMGERIELLEGQLIFQTLDA